MKSATLLSLSWQHIVILVMCLPLYFIPTFIAFIRKKPNPGVIFALNLLLGWTFIGWIGALVWALLNEKDNQQITSLNTTSNIDQLVTLKQLYDQGVITKEEFEAQKNKLLQ
ncbi:superinfection immunity protein [uncultured Chryseobacterium sp.]|uniref:superinfection immunity protein n=1 Tax=uncultured Chryseobacterium sp. TaxID=259322 RepID=UPI0025FDE968|nr:superinfection immunity protein [uncultured Chryseobacterium sp.]